MEYKIGRFILTFPDDIGYYICNDESGEGIRFHIDGKRYEMLNSLLGMRLLINWDEFSWKDIPFHEGTTYILPDIIEVKCIIH